MTAEQAAIQHVFRVALERGYNNADRVIVNRKDWPVVALDADGAPRGGGDGRGGPADLVNLILLKSSARTPIHQLLEPWWDAEAEP